MTMIYRHAEFYKKGMFASIFKNIQQFPICIVNLIVEYINLFDMHRFRLILRHKFLSEQFASVTSSRAGGYGLNCGGFEIIPDVLISIHELIIDIEFMENTRLLHDPESSNAWLKELDVIEIGN